MPGWAWAAGLFVLSAVLLEAVAGQLGGVAVPRWVYAVVPSTWAPLPRAGWWVVVAAAAVAFRLAERRAGVRRNPLIILGSTIPFAAFAIGVAVEAPWAAWH